MSGTPIYYEVEYLQIGLLNQGFEYNKTLPQPLCGNYYLKVVRIKFLNRTAYNTINRIALVLISPSIMNVYYNTSSPGNIIADFEPNPSGKTLYEPKEELYDLGKCSNVNKISFRLYYQDNTLQWHPFILSPGDYINIRFSFIKK